jgi:uncharacterized protein YecE (DUF72 family)
LNVTFYRFPELAVFKSWYQRSSPDFTFSVKAPRLVTHYKRMNECEQLLTDFYERVSEGLKEKTGCVLFQFPPRFDYTTDRLDKIINNLNPRFPNVVEFRNSSWWNKDVYKILGENNITFSGMSHPDLPETIVENTPMLYYRMHGVPQLYSSPYSLAYLKKMVKTIKSSVKIKNAFIYFNNDIGGNATKNAEEMIAML